MRTDCIVKLSKLQISELNTLVQKETSGDAEGKPPSDTPPQRGYPAEAVNETVLVRLVRRVVRRGADSRLA
jgi:hypothetical protein